MSVLDNVGSGILTISGEALDVAITQIGKKENPKGSNWGEPVKDYLKSVGINFPASWCMAFVYWCYDTASHNLGINNPLVKTGGVLAQWNNIDKDKKINLSNLLKDSSPLKPGDIFIMNYGQGLGHTGIIESIGKNKIHTIEGNTNDTGSREGYEVCRKIRLLASPIIGCISL